MNLYRTALEYEQAKGWAGCVARRLADAKVMAREALDASGLTIECITEKSAEYAKRLVNIEEHLKTGPRTQQYTLKDHLADGEIQELDHLLNELEISNSYLLDEQFAARAVHGGRALRLRNAVYIVPHFGWKMAGSAAGTTIAGALGWAVGAFVWSADSTSTPEEIKFASGISFLAYATLTGSICLGVVALLSSKNPFTTVAENLQKNAAYIQEQLGTN